MKIAIIFINIGHYHYARLEAAQTAATMRGWKVQGVQLTAHTLRHPWGRLKDGAQLPIVTIDQTSRTVTPRGDIPRVSKQDVQNCLDAIDPDVVFLPGWSFDLCRKCLAWCRRRQVPAVLMSESKYDDEPRWWLKERLKSWLFVRHFAAAIVGGERHRQYAASLGIRPEAIFLGYDIIDNDYFIRGADVARSHSDKVRIAIPAIPIRPYFIAATRLVARKNVRRLIRAFHQYRRKVPVGTQPWDLVICGNGPELGDVRAEITKLGLEESVHIPGFISYSDMPAWYGLASAFVHPALHEQWGLVLNEASASGLPLIVSSTVGAGHDLVLDGRNGVLVNPQDDDDIAAKLTLVSLKDESELRAMGGMSRTLVRRFSPDSFGEGVVNAVLAACRLNGG
jgi:1,2-diacylglycerol 3-alpha-glucosyltransferase